MEIKDIPLFKGLSNAEIRSVEGCLKHHHYEKGEFLFTEGNACEKIIFVREGRVKIFRMASSGREQILEMLTAGDTCACNPGEAKWYCSSSAQATTPCEVWFLTRMDYVNLVNNNSKLAHTLNELFAEKLQCLTALVEQVSLKDVKQRLVKFLLDMLAEKERKKSVNNSLFIPFTREEIAQRLGTSRETIARYLSQLKSDKLIEIKPYQINILDRKGLGKLLG